LTRLKTPLWGGHALAGVAWCDWRDGLLNDAAEKYTQVRASGEQLGEPTLIATGLEGLARVVAAKDGMVDAAASLRQATDVRDTASRPAPPHEQKELDELRRVLAAGDSEPLRLSSPRGAVDPAAVSVPVQ
jgi:hypothetical protein